MTHVLPDPNDPRIVGWKCDHYAITLLWPGTLKSMRLVDHGCNMEPIYG